MIGDFMKVQSWHNIRQFERTSSRKRKKRAIIKISISIVAFFIDSVSIKVEKVNDEHLARENRSTFEFCNRTLAQTNYRCVTIRAHSYLRLQGYLRLINVNIQKFH